jgi:hypothetical protein
VLYRVFIGRPEGKRPLGRPMSRWEDNIKMEFREIGIDWANWIRLAQDRVQWRVEFVYDMMSYVILRSVCCAIIVLTDFEKAYDSVRRELLYNILIEFGIHMRLVRLFPWG